MTEPRLLQDLTEEEIKEKIKHFEDELAHREELEEKMNKYEAKVEKDKEGTIMISSKKGMITQVITVSEEDFQVLYESMKPLAKAHHFDFQQILKEMGMDKWCETERSQHPFEVTFKHLMGA